jgi:WD40 repeat protein
MAFSLNPDKDEFVTASRDGTLTFWTDAKKQARRIDCNEILRAIDPNESPRIKKIDNLAFSPSGKYAVVQAEVGFKESHQSKILLFNPEKVSSSPKLIPPRHMRLRNIKFGGLAISPGENQLALGLSNGRIQEWDLTSTSGPIELLGHQGAVFSVAYSPMGDYLASAGADMKVKLWKWNANAKSWDEVKNKAKFSAFDDAVVSVAFSHDGKLLAAGSNDRTAKVFDLHGRLLHSFNHPAGINDVAFSRDDKNLAAACDDSRWYTHPLDLDEAEAQAKKKVTRKLTQDECEKFGIVRASTPDSVPSP